MKCERDDCFAYTPVLENHCSALTDTYRCHFYKTKEELRSQEEMLLSEGHPIYRPSRTRAEQRLLKRLLNGERTDDMD